MNLTAGEVETILLPANQNRPISLLNPYILSPEKTNVSVKFASFMRFGISDGIHSQSPFATTLPPTSLPTTPRDSP